MRRLTLFADSIIRASTFLQGRPLRGTKGMASTPSSVYLNIGTEETQVLIDGDLQLLTLGSQLTSLGFFAINRQRPTKWKMRL